MNLLLSMRIFACLNWEILRIKLLNITLIEEAIPVAFEVENEVIAIYAYPDIPKLGNPNIPTFYELMAKQNLDMCNGSSITKDEIGEEWKTYISKKLTKFVISTYFMM